MHDALRCGREAVFLGAVVDAGEDSLTQIQHPLVGRQFSFEPLGKSIDRGPDIADHLEIRMVDLFDSGGLVADMDDLRSARTFHEEGRLLDRVVADGDDQVGAFNRLVDVVALRERRGSHVEVRAAGDRPLAHLGVEERQPRAPHEARKSIDQRGPVACRTEHDERTAGTQDYLRRAVERPGRGNGPLRRVDGNDGGVLDLLGSDVLGQFQVDRPRSLLHGDAKGVAHRRGYGGGTDDLARHLGQRLH